MTSMPQSGVSATPHKGLINKSQAMPQSGVLGTPHKGLINK